MKSKIVYDNYDVPLMWTTGRGRLREMFSVVELLGATSELVLVAVCLHCV